MTKDNTDKNIVSNEKINPVKLERAKKIILELQNELKSLIAEGAGPFLAAVYNAEGKLIAKTANSVVTEGCSNNHAEMNAIRAAEKALNTFDLSSANLSLYVTAEPCMMCLRGIMWSGIKAVYFGCRPKGLKKLPDLTKDLSRTGSTNSKNAELPFTEILKARPAKKFCAAMLPPAKKSISRKGHKNSLGKNI